MQTGTSWRRASMEEPRALTTSTAAFAASWRDSNYAIKADNYENKKTVKMKIMEVKTKAFMGFILPATMVSDSASRARTALASSSAA